MAFLEKFFRKVKILKFLARHVYESAEMLNLFDTDKKL